MIQYLTDDYYFLLISYTRHNSFTTSAIQMYTIVGPRPLICKSIPLYDNLYYYAKYTRSNIICLLQIKREVYVGLPTFCRVLHLPAWWDLSCMVPPAAAAHLHQLPGHSFPPAETNCAVEGLDSIELNFLILSQLYLLF